MGPMLASITAGLVAGVSSVPHCMGMCGPLVAGVCSGPRDGAAYQVGRTVSYSVLGAVAGAVAGNAIERSATREDAVEILLQMRNGERRAIVQARGAETLVPGDAVILVMTGGKARVTRAPR